MASMTFEGSSLYVGVYVTDVELLKNILRFRDLLDGKKVKNCVFEPILSTHISLARFSLSKTILDYSSFSKIKALIYKTVNSFSFFDRCCTPTRYSFGKESDSVKIYFDRSSRRLIENIRYTVIQHAEEEGIFFNDDRLYIPHLTIIRSMFGCNRDDVKDVISLMNSTTIPTFRISNISMLAPNRSSNEEDRTIIRKVKELSVSFN